MRLLKRNERQQPRISIVLLDWSVRESFHLLHYLRQQSVPRDLFEVLLIEYYSRVSPAAQPYAGDIDTWALLEMPEECYYHKHLMYNVGIALSRGEICVFCDSDAMVKPSFVGAILEQFERDPQSVLHIDQFRNMRRDFYPFSFPSFEDVLGRGCINRVNGKTRGLASLEDLLHERNYGACMCARRDDLIAIGGSDEHVDYLGHICGPYDMTFRLVNFGRREVWHESEFMYHTWHPGQAGVANYLGPHDGRHMSTTALEALATGRIQPFEENPAIAYLRQNGTAPREDVLLSLLVSERRAQRWRSSELDRLSSAPPARTVLYRGFRIEPNGERYVGSLILNDVVEASGLEPIVADTEAAVREGIDAVLNHRVKLVTVAASIYVLAWRVLAVIRILALRGLRFAAALPRRGWRTGLAMMRRLGDPGVVARVWRAVRGGVISLATGRTVRRGWQALQSKLAQTTDRWNRFLMERRFFAGTLGSLLVNLHFLGRLRNGTAMPPPVVIVDRRAVSHYLRSLAAVRAMPPVDVIQVRSTPDLDQWVATFSSEAFAGHIVVGRDFYMRHYGSLSTLRARRRLVVA